MIKPPEPNELSWKDTVRMNPLEDVVVALRPARMNVPFPVPNSERTLDVTMMRDMTSSTMFTNVDPSNQPAPVTNAKINFGWEYVWHCHLLGHEENDMMRPMILAVSPDAPSALAAAVSRGAITVTWTDNAYNETGFTLERAPSGNGPWTAIAHLPAATGTGSQLTFPDRSVASGVTYFYRAEANNVVGYTQPYAPPTQGYPSASADSTPSNVASARAQ